MGRWQFVCDNELLATLTQHDVCNANGLVINRIMPCHFRIGFDLLGTMFCKVSDTMLVESFECFPPWDVEENRLN